MDTKQVIVVNKSLSMPTGKLAAQVAHASIGALLETSTQNNTEIKIPLHNDIREWLLNKFTKIVTYVKSEQALVSVYKKAKQAGLPAVLITDSGKTVFNKPTITCVGIGPSQNDDFVGITDKLRLL